MRLSQLTKPLAMTTTPHAMLRGAGSLVELLVRERAMTVRGAGVPAAKRILDCALAAVMAIVAAPVVLVAALAVRLTSRGPVIYTQERVGFGDRRFTIYKIRTMIHDCESLTGPKWSEPGDPRVTPVGQILRRLHIDELPQLINVFRGEMSLVGPRPERPVFVAKLSRKIRQYPVRHSVAPGITGLAQLFLPPDIDVADVERKLTYDLYYARNASVWLDVKVIFCTALKVLGVSRQWMRKLLPLRADVDIAPETLAFPEAHWSSRAA
jgi:lipopolysaccharide/colanic/teichoic acid biosynthesis glycosyltransferase